MSPLFRELYQQELQLLLGGLKLDWLLGRGYTNMDKGGATWTVEGTF